MIGIAIGNTIGRKASLYWTPLNSLGGEKVDFWVKGRSGNIMPSQITGGQPATILPVYNVFNGTSDYAELNNAFLNTSSGEVEAYLKIVNGEAQTVFSSCDKDSLTLYFGFLITTDRKVQISCRNSATFTNLITTDNAVDEGWHTIIWGSTGSAYYIKVDGVSVAISGSTNNGKWFNTVPNRDRIGIGTLTRSTRGYSKLKCSYVKVDSSNYWVCNNEGYIYDIIGGLHIPITFGAGSTTCKAYDNIPGHCLIYGYSLYVRNNVASSLLEFQIPHDLNGNPLAVQSNPTWLFGGTLEFVKDVAGDLSNHNLADTQIEMPTDQWDISNTTQCNTSAQTGWYNAVAPKRWNVFQLNQNDLCTSYYKANYNGQVFVKMTNDSVSERQALTELFSFPTNKTGNNFKKALVYSGNYEFVYNSFFGACSDYAISPVNYPAGLYYNGNTYITFQGNDDDCYITKYNHMTKAWTTPVFVGVNPLVNGDGHGVPAMFIDPNGYIRLLWGSHVVNPHFQYSVSNNPEDISAWTALASPADGTYPQIIQFSNGDIYFFHRAAQGGTWGYKKSTDGGVTWGAFVLVLNDIAYAQFKKGEGDIIHCSGWGNSTAGTDRYNMYYLKFDGTKWTNIAGTELTIPLSTPWTDILIYNSGTKAIPCATVTSNSSNTPFIFYMEGLNSDETGTISYKLMRWNGVMWDNISIGVSTKRYFNITSAIDLQSGGKIDVYVITGTKTGILGGNVEKWSSTDNGTTWSQSKVILNGSSIWCVMVHNCLPEAKLLFSEYRGSSSTWTGRSYLWGNNGFVKNKDGVNW